MIRFRADSELKGKLEAIAPRRRKLFPEFMREELWKIVEREEAQSGPIPIEKAKSEKSKGKRR